MSARIQKGPLTRARIYSQTVLRDLFSEHHDLVGNAAIHLQHADITAAGDTIGSESLEVGARSTAAEIHRINNAPLQIHEREFHSTRSRNLEAERHMRATEGGTEPATMRSSNFGNSDGFLDANLRPRRIAPEGITHNSDTDAEIDNIIAASILAQLFK